MLQPVFTALPNAPSSSVNHPRVFTAPTSTTRPIMVRPVQTSAKPPPIVFTAPPTTRPEMVKPVQTLAKPPLPIAKTQWFDDDDENPFLDKKSNSRVDKRRVVTRHVNKMESMFLVPLEGESVPRAIGLRPSVGSHKNRNEVLVDKNEMLLEPRQTAYELSQKTLAQESPDTKYIDVLEGAIRHPSFAFMSYEMIADEKRKVTEQDDLQSFFWTILYHILRYTDHNGARAPGETDPDGATPRPNLHALMASIFNKNEEIEKNFGPGFSKMLLLLTGRPLPLDFEVKGNQPLTGAMQLLLERFQTKMEFTTRDVPKKVRSISRTLGVDYDAAHDYYLSTREYADKEYRHNIKHDDLLSILGNALAKENWPADDRSVDGLEKWVKELHSACSDAEAEYK